MASPLDPRAFGRAIAQIRRAKGLRQRDVAERIDTYYSDERSYRRIETGERLPGRDAAIAILKSGLEVGDAEKVDGVLALAGYDPLIRDETPVLKPNRVISEPIRPGEVQHVPWLVCSGRSVWLVVIPLVGTIVISGLVGFLSGNPAIVIGTAAVYGLLYAVSLLLESAMDTRAMPVMPVAVWLFCLIATSSTIALALDTWLARVGNPAALLIVFGVFLVSAAAQWLIARSVLSESAVVPMQFQAHTAQAAHLKNTSYYLAIVALFWLPPFHCVQVLHRELELGHTATVEAQIARRLITGRDFVAPSPETLWFMFLALGLLAIPMAVRLLENLKAHPGINRYTSLAYVRAVLYFLLVLVCVFWYSAEIAGLPVGDRQL